jgi:hypothetical protein
MNANLLFQISSLAVCIPLFAAWVFIKRIEKLYHPFLYLILLSGVTEISNNFILSYYNLALPANILILGDAMLITWASNRWGLYKNRKRLYHILQLTIFFSWIAESYIQSWLHHYNRPINTKFHFDRAKLLNSRYGI